jgi:acyl-CoA thioesterase-1
VRTWRITSIVAVCFFTSCQKTASVPKLEERMEPAASSTPAPAADNRPVIVTFGDSLTAGVAGRSYPDDLQDLLDRNGLRYRVDNQGVSGDTSTDGLARIDNVIAQHPRLVLLEFGGNDGLRGVPVTATEKNLGEMIRRLKTENIPVVLLGITLPPNYGPDFVKPFTEMFPRLAKTYQLKLMPFLLVDVYQKSSLMQPDGIHPNGDGNKIVAHDVFELVRPLLMNSHKTGAVSGATREKLARSFADWRRPAAPFALLK